MKIAATMINEVATSAVTLDGRHVALTLRDDAGNLLTLGLPGETVPHLIDHAVSALTERQRILRLDTIRTNRFAVTWWNFSRDSGGNGYVLSLTFGTGGSLDFMLTPHMAERMLDTLRCHLGS
jgi:hypothetical protein